MSKKTNEKLREKDEQILGAIIAGAGACGRKVQPHYTQWGTSSTPAVNGSGMGSVSWENVHGSCCAVGVGLLYAGQKRSKTPCKDFAKKYAVNLGFAHGVSDGFEGQDDANRPSVAYQRGVAVGRAAFDALCLETAS